MNNTNDDYAYRTELPITFEQAVDRVTSALQTEGFGVLTEIDVKATLKKKLNAEFRKYSILGACNPPLAHQALQSETDIGLLLPCNLVVYQGQSEADSVVAVLDPEAQLSVAGRDDIGPLAREVKERMGRALDSL